ncbi:MAG: Gfo/Idh/MocA family oxidoreductase [Martelella sp.]|uniref:Gfo/Idh/MocA family protein n=1 Tax=Martelella sp. TaxID=1969699 RepID=UPI0032427B12
MNISQPKNGPFIKPAAHKPRIGFLGTGWIGQSRLKAIADTGVAEIVAVADASDEALEQAYMLAPTGVACRTLDELLKHDLDAVVIATPTARHAQETIAVLRAGKAVFVQKPLGRTADETAAVIAAAEQADRLLGVDFSYRETEGLQAIRRMIAGGELGKVFAVDLVFHNAYGPNKAWYYDKALSGGGSVIDLGVHLVDTALWCLDFPAVQSVEGRLFRDGRLLPRNTDEIEDFAVASIDLDGGVRVSLSCSWNAHAGRNAAISAHFHGSDSSALWQNSEGSFFDFTTELHQGTSRERTDVSPPGWYGREAARFARRVAEDTSFNSEIRHAATVAEVLDRIYGRR